MELNKYTFEVAKDANKYQIKDAVEEIFGVKVVRVNTLTVKPKTKRVRYVAGKTRSWKKAIVTLAEGDTIEVLGVLNGHARNRVYVRCHRTRGRTSNPCLRWLTDSY